MDWTPLSESELTILIADAMSAMEPQTQCLWDFIRIPPTKWVQHPWGDQGGGFWVVTIVGMRMVWYNDIEDGFNVSRYTMAGVISEYSCNQASRGKYLSPHPRSGERSYRRQTVPYPTSTLWRA